MEHGRSHPAKLDNAAVAAVSTHMRYWFASKGAASDIVSQVVVRDNTEYLPLPCLLEEGTTSMHTGTRPVAWRWTALCLVCCLFFIFYPVLREFVENKGVYKAGLKNNMNGTSWR